jgi:hypothetical protein
VLLGRSGLSVPTAAGILIGFCDKGSATIEAEGLSLFRGAWTFLLISSTRFSIV